MPSLPRIGFHSVAVVLDYCSLYWSLSINSLFNHFVMLTTLTHMTHTLFFTFALIYSIYLYLTSNNNSNDKNNNKVNNNKKFVAPPPGFMTTIFFVVSICSLMTTILYWGLWLTDPDLVFPKKFEHLYPIQLNIYQHLGVTIIIIIEYLFIFHMLNFKTHVMAIIGVLCAYMSWIYVQKQLFGKFPYPLYEKFDSKGHLIFNCIAITICVVVIATIFGVHRFWWKEHHEYHNNKNNNNNSKRKVK